MRTNSEIKTYETRDAFEADIDQIARLQLRREKLKATRDLESQRVLDKYNPEISALDGQIEELQNRALPYASANRERLFGKGKSASCSLATYGFKTGNKTLSNKSGKPDNVVACELVERKRTDCAKVSYSLDKTGIKKALKMRDSQIESCTRQLISHCGGALSPKASARRNLESTLYCGTKYSKNGAGKRNPSPKKRRCGTR